MASGRFHERLAGEKHLQRVVSKDEEKNENGWRRAKFGFHLTLSNPLRSFRMLITSFNIPYSQNLWWEDCQPVGRKSHQGWQFTFRGFIVKTPISAAWLIFDPIYLADLADETMLNPELFVPDSWTSPDVHRFST